MDTDYANSVAMKEARFQRRVLEAQWHGGDVQFGKSGEPGSYVKSYPGMKKLDKEIPIRWQDGEPENGDIAVAECLIDGEKREYIIEPIYLDGDKERKRLAKDYKALAEKWALWKWHTARGTPVSEHGAYLTEPGFTPPTFVWETKRGPGRPKNEA